MWGSAVLSFSLGFPVVSTSDRGRAPFEAELLKKAPHHTFTNPRTYSAMKNLLSTFSNNSAIYNLDT